MTVDKVLSAVKANPRLVTALEHFKAGIWNCGSEFKSFDSSVKPSGQSKGVLPVRVFAQYMSLASDWYSAGDIETLKTMTKKYGAAGPKVLDANALFHGAVSKLSKELAELETAIDDLRLNTPVGADSKPAVSLVHKRSVDFLSRVKDQFQDPGKWEYDAEVSQVYKQYFISSCLLSRGRIMVVAGDAVLAEGLFKAAIDQSKIGSAKAKIPLFSSLIESSNRGMADLFLKWSGRESEGEKILSVIGPLEPSNSKTLKAIMSGIVPSYSHCCEIVNRDLNTHE